MGDENLLAVVARSTFGGAKAKLTSRPEHFWKLRCSKSVRRSGGKQASKSKFQNRMPFSVLEDDMFKKCRALLGEARFQFNIRKAPHAQTIFEGSDAVMRARHRGFYTLPNVSRT